MDYWKKMAHKTSNLNGLFIDLKIKNLLAAWKKLFSRITECALMVFYFA